jgi:hypothetical protein
MKFRQGAWLWRSGVTHACVKRVAEYRIDGDVLWLAAVDRAGAMHTDTFEGTILELRVSSPMPDVVRVQARAPSSARDRADVLSISTTR